MFYVGMLDHIIVEINGAKMPLNRVSLVSVLDPKTLSVMPYDPNVRNSFFLIFTVFLFYISYSCTMLLNQFRLTDMGHLFPCRP